ncbi:MAG: pyridoxamine 5'-phosphate oxidase [Planctomycetes bacterium]|nr:pyridoxamine 5'-phosphate oxidase [Planctomycetota bacterium]
MPEIDLSAIFSPHNTLPDSLPADPWPLFRAWFDEAACGKVTPNPNAFTLACLDENGIPTARIVLCKKMLDAGAIVFHTNYLSRKGKGLTAHPRAAAVFHWDSLEKQVRIEGPVVKSPASESDAYFKTRGWENRLGAWASDQSQPIESREALLFKVAEAMDKVGVSIKDIMDKGNDVEIPRPPHWGGWRLWAERVELWLGGPGRVHDRAVWTRTLKASSNEAEFECGPWASTRLQP